MGCIDTGPLAPGLTFGQIGAPVMQTVQMHYLMVVMVAETRCKNVSCTRSRMQSDSEGASEDDPTKRTR